MWSDKKRIEENPSPKGCLLVLLLLLGAGLLAIPSGITQSQVSCGGRETHDPIHISEDHGPQGFTWTDPATGEQGLRPGSGVVAGDGSPSDPFVIAGWCIEQSLGALGPGVHIEQTSAHVVVRDNVVVHRGPHMDEMAIRVENAQNMVLRENLAAGAYHGIGVWFSDDVVVEKNTLVDNAFYGIWVAQLDGAVIRENHIHSNENGIGTGLATNTVVESNTVVRNANAGIVNSFSDDLVIRDNLVQDNREGIYIREAVGTVVENNQVLDHTGGGVAFDMATDGELIGNTITGTGQEGVIFWSAPRGTAIGNMITQTGVADDRAGLRFSGAADSVATDNVLIDNAQGIILEGAPDSLVERNIISGSTGPGMWSWQTTGAQVRDNAITGNSPGIRVDLDATGTVFTGNNIQANAPGIDARNADNMVDAKGNWWGCSKGPGNTGCDAAFGSVDTSEALSAPNPAAPSPPMVDVPTELEGRVGQELVVEVSASHSSGQSVSLTARSLPAGAVFTVTNESSGSAQGVLTWNPMLHQEGTHTIVFQAEAAGMQGESSLRVLVRPPTVQPGELRLSRISVPPAEVSPGQTLQLHARLENLGDTTLDVPMGASSTQGGWNVSTPGGIRVGPRESVPVTVNVTVGPDGSTSTIDLVAQAAGVEESRTSVSWSLDVPVSVEIFMDATTTGQAITGTVKTRFADGSDASGVFITGSRTNGFDTQGLLRSGFSGRTNETGELPIEFGIEDAGAQLPGTHIVSLVAQRDHRNFRGHTSYQVGLL